MLDLTNARAFNNSLKKAINQKLEQKVKVEIINSYKFPNCWVRVYSDSTFPNDFRMEIFKACGFKEENLLNKEDISYGNIQSRHISASVKDWVKLTETF